MPTYRDLAARALALAATAPLTPAAYRDATGTSRKYVMAILEDLDRRGILRRTARRPRPGPARPRAGAGDRHGDGRRDRAGRRPVVAVRARQARRADRRPAAARSRDRGGPRRRRRGHRGRRRPGAVTGASPPGVRVVHDARAFEGPLAGVAAGLAATDAEVASSSAGDMPSLVPAVLRPAGRRARGRRRRRCACSRSVDDPAARCPMALRRVRRAASAADAPRRPASAGSGRCRDGSTRSAIPDAEWRQDDPDGAHPRRHRHAGRPALTGPDTRRPPPEGRRSFVLWREEARG